MTEQNEKITYDATDLLYAAARAHALENGLLNRERREKLISARDTAETLRVLTDCGYSFASREHPDYGLAMKNMRRETFATAEAMLGNGALLAPLRLEYDCHNLKYAIKSGISGSFDEALMLDVGTVPAQTALKAVRERDFRGLPEAMGAAAEKAMNAYAAHPDPRQIDAILDAACYRDMLRAAALTGCGFVTDYVKIKIDLTNILMTARCILLGWKSRKTAEWLISGGTVDTGVLAGCADGGMQKLLDCVKYTRYGGTLSDIPADIAPGALEKLCKKHELEFVRSSRLMSSGLPAVYTYIIERETEIRNIRVILAEKSSGQKGDAVREHISTELD